MTGVRRARAGFTLVEILVALVILAFGLAAILTLFSQATRTHKRSVDATAVAALAQAVLADAQADLDAGAAPKPVQGQTFPGFSAEYRYDLEFTALGGPGYEVRVVVKYGGTGAGARQETFETVLIRNGVTPQGGAGAGGAAPKKGAPAKGGS